MPDGDVEARGVDGLERGTRGAASSDGRVPTQLAEALAAHPVAVSAASRQVADFHRAYELPLRTDPTADIGAAQVELRQALIEEEVAELRAAATRGDMVGIADALADIVYVAYGTAHVYGIHLDAVLDEVHASNMTKLGADGRPVRRADGKVLKGPDYRPPDIAAVLHRLVEETAPPRERDYHRSQPV